MAARITSLPPELLHGVLGSAILSRNDIYKCIQVCRFFHEVGKQYLTNDAEIVLSSNQPRQLTSFLRKLLAEPSFGSNFTELLIAWGFMERVNYGKDDSLKTSKDDEESQRPFKWTQEESAKLSDLAKKYNFHPRWVESIEELTDPASLLIPIICLLPNLEELDMGSPIVNAELEGVYNDCLDSHLEEFIQRLILDDKKHLDDVQEIQSGFPDAFKSLKVFSRGDNEDETGFDVEKIFPVFLFPNIRTIKLNVLGGEFEMLDRFEDSGYKCGVEHLELYLIECEAEELARLLAFCQGLRTLKIRLQWVGMGIVEAEDDKEEMFDLTSIAGTVLSHHRETLMEAEVEVEDNDYWWFKRKKAGGKYRCGRKPSWWGNVDWSDDDEND